jgi:hypothetical protein
MRKNVVIAENFYERPETIRALALSLRYYYPYQSQEQLRFGVRPNWTSSWFKPAAECPFKSSWEIIRGLEDLVGEEIDMEHWCLDFPIDVEGRAAVNRLHSEHSCLWNCSFHVKFLNDQPLGEGVHNHVTDAWNSVGSNGWAGLIYLESQANLQGGLKLWRNKDRGRNFDWMTPRENWEMVDDLGNVFNRLILVRGDLPHSGAAGWGDRLENGRLFQTFFFKVKQPRLNPSIEVRASFRYGAGE